MYTERARQSLLGGVGGGQCCGSGFIESGSSILSESCSESGSRVLMTKNWKNTTEEIFFFLFKNFVTYPLVQVGHFCPPGSNPVRIRNTGVGGGWHILPTTGGQNSTISQGDDRDRDHVLKNSFSQFCKKGGEGKELL